MFSDVSDFSKEEPCGIRPRSHLVLDLTVTHHHPSGNATLDQQDENDYVQQTAITF